MAVCNPQICLRRLRLCWFQKVSSALQKADLREDGALDNCFRSFHRASHDQRLWLPSSLWYKVASIPTPLFAYHSQQLCLKEHRDSASDCSSSKLHRLLTPSTACEMRIGGAFQLYDHDTGQQESINPMQQFLCFPAHSITGVHNSNDIPGGQTSADHDELEARKLWRAVTAHLPA